VPPFVMEGGQRPFGILGHVGVLGDTSRRWLMSPSYCLGASGNTGTITFLKVSLITPAAEA